MNQSAMEETILVFVHNLGNDFLKPIRQNFSDQLQAAVKERDWPEVINTFRRINLGD